MRTHDHNISLQAGAVDGVLLHHHTVALHLIAHLALAIEVADDGEEWAKIELVQHVESLLH